MKTISFLATILTTAALLVALAAAMETPPILNHCDGDFCYRNGYKIDSHNNYIED